MLATLESLRPVHHQTDTTAKLYILCDTFCVILADTRFFEQQNHKNKQ
tara:strand:- start:682 stop:825 length:144 start_codon:yes stop_codon:yes gene_type:complete